MPDEPQPGPKRARRRIRHILIACLGIYGCILLGDFAYSRIVTRRHRQWESTVKRNSDRVRAGCESFAIGTGETALLLIHGINDSPHFYYKMAPQLAKQGFACHAIRLPGFAKPTAEYAQATRQDWVAAVNAKVRDLRKTHPRVCIVAHSLGAAGVIQHLLQNPSSVDAVVLLAPGIAVANQRSPLLPVRTWQTVANTMLIFTRITESPFPIDAQDPLEANSAFRTPFTPRETIRETLLLFDENRSRAADLQVPLLMVLAAHDQVIDVDAARAFFAETESAGKELRVMPDAGHALAVDYGWEDLTGHITTFVRTVETSATTKTPVQPNR